MVLTGTSAIQPNGHLHIGGVDAVSLAKEYGTPLYVYDVAHMREQARAFKQAFEQRGVDGQVAYASKAFSCLAMVQIMNEEGLNLDVVSGGELYTALQAGFPAENIHFHGNNKSYAEIEMAVNAGVGCFIADNFYELSLLKRAAAKTGRTLPVLLRTTPGIKAQTHDYIATGQEDSKFGFDLESGQLFDALSDVLANDAFDCLGLHCHIGSQIFDTGRFRAAIEKMYAELERRFDELRFVPKVLNLGGGFGIRYVSGDTPKPAEHFVESMIDTVVSESERLGFSVPEIWIEPGRAIAGSAGTTLYTVGSQKDIPNIRKYIAVDGGMADNLRPALYQAQYEGILANRGLDPKKETVSVAGKCCETGDMLIWDLRLPEVKPDDLLAVFCTGAYGYAMANNYNRLPRPAVVFVEDGDAQVVVKRETYEDLVKRDVPLKKQSIVP
ncbi:MAG TPA: diaminopimelate decarboxylase [Bacillales bacterium]|nr:diaminopimelate decarboxylase [Bacillales bacterium]